MGPAGEALLGRGEVDGSTSLFLAQRHARWAGFDERKKRSVVANAAIARELAGQASAGNSKRDTDRACGVPSPVSRGAWRRHRTTSLASRVVKPMAPGAALHRSTRRAPHAIAIAVRRERGMSFNVTRKLIGSHLVSGEMTPGEEIAIHIDQTLTQDATGTLVMQELEALGLDRARTEVSVQYVDHNLLQTDEKNAEDHEYLRTAAQRFGLWYSKPGNGVSHPTHMQRFGIPGKTMVGSDSHTP